MLFGLLFAIGAQRKPRFKKVHARGKNPVCSLSNLIGGEKTRSTDNSQQSGKTSHIHHIPVISSISSEARVSYLCCVASTLPLGNSRILPTGCEATIENGAFKHTYQKTRSSVGFFVFVSPPRRSGTPTQVVSLAEREKKCSSTPSFSNSAHYAQLDVNVHICLLMCYNVHLHRLSAEFPTFDSTKKNN